MPGLRLLDPLAVEVVEGAHLAPRVAGDDRVADAQGAPLDEHRRDRAAPDVEPALDDGAGRWGRRVGGQLELGVRDEEHLLEQVVEVLAGLRGDVRELRRPAPLLRLEPFRDELLADARRVRVVPVDLVHGDHHRHLGGARMADRLLRLRHDAVVGGDDQHGDVGDLGAACAERRERLVAGRVEERDPAAVVIDLIRADVLRDAAGLRLDDRALADRVEQRRLAVVDVAHDGHDGRPRHEVRRVVLVDLDLELLGRVLDLDLAAELSGDQLDRPVAERLRDRDHLADAHHDLDDLARPERRTRPRGP